MSGIEEYEKWRDEALQCWPFKTIREGLNHAYEMGRRHAQQEGGHHVDRND
jgi:hypothetical protein